MNLCWICKQVDITKEKDKMAEEKYEFDIIDGSLVTALGEAPEMIIP